MGRSAGDPRGRILALLVYGGFLAPADPLNLCAAAFPAAAALPYLARSHGLLRGLGSVRWLLLAVFLTYGWWTPGEPLWSALGAWSPSRSGLAAAGARTAMLVLAVLAARTLLATTPRPALVAGLAALLAPLRWLGAAPQRLALRLGLTLEVAEALLAGRAAVRGRALPALRSHYAAAAVPAPLPAFELPALGAPWHALVLPLALAGVLLGLRAACAAVAG